MKLFICALDGSPRAAGVLEAARAHAAAAGGRLVLVQAVTPMMMPAGLEPLAPLDLMDRIVAAARKDLEAVAAKVPPGMVEGVSVELGIPWQTITEQAKTRNAAGIFIGAHGYTLLDRALGTTAQRVVDHADRPVFVVREAGKGQKSVVVAALDDTAHAPAVLAAAVEAARSRAAVLKLIRVVPDLGKVPMAELAEPLNALTTAILKTARERLEHLAEGLQGISVAGFHVEIGTPWRGICQHAATENAALIVVGAHVHPLLQRALGTTAARVVNHAECTVLVMPAPAS